MTRFLNWAKKKTKEEKTPKVFSVTANVVDGGRLDPFYHEPEYKRIKKAISKGKYKTEILNNLLYLTCKIPPFNPYIFVTINKKLQILQIE